uniref:Uncharacterized protein n=1 Tax=Trichogramma kaykai TaxID=54128 RepID=A0ABD2WW38_9HYME
MRYSRVSSQLNNKSCSLEPMCTRSDCCCLRSFPKRPQRRHAAASTRSVVIFSSGCSSKHRSLTARAPRRRIYSDGLGAVQ